MTLDVESAYDVGFPVFANLWTPRAPLGTADWAQRYRRLSSKSSAEPGKWRNDRVPYLRGIMDALDESHPAPLVVFKKSSQVGGSECAVNWIGRVIHQAPGSILALFPSDKDARKWSKTRLGSALAETPELRALVPPGRRSDAGNTLQEKHYPGGVLFTGSANIPTDVASVSVPYVLLDEVDRMPLSLEGEGDPVELAKRRASTFPLRKIFEISSPTEEETSRIHADYEQSTQDRYYVPCPDCRHMQALVWANLKWTGTDYAGARYACEECGTLIEEHQKTEMLAAGEWRPTFPEREAICKGFHINALYSPIGLGDTWADHAAAWDRAQTSSASLQVFYNTRLGEVVKSQRIRLAWETVYGRRENYRLRTITRRDPRVERQTRKRDSR